MDSHMQKVKRIIKEHKYAILAAVLCGLIMIGPHIFFALKLGNAYRGIYIIQTDSEHVYLARMQEIIDGHPLMGSVPFLEYKDKPPLIPPTLLDLTFVFSSKIFSVSLVNILIFSKFLLPAILFMLIYTFVFKVSEDESSFSKFNAIAAATLVVLGYDAIGLKTIEYLRNAGSAFLLWSRPINPIFGGVLLFSILLILWVVMREDKLDLTKIISGAVILFFAYVSYFFSWGMMLSILGTLFILSIVYRRYTYTKNILGIALLGTILAVPYFYFTYHARLDPIYPSASIRIGLITGHWAVFSFVLLGVLALFLFFIKSDRRSDWWMFCMAVILGGLWALNQQIITGITIYPFHFVQYTKPLAVAVLFPLLFIKFSSQYKLVYKWMLGFVILYSVFFGIYVQAATYQGSFDRYADIQRYKSAFNWFSNNTPKDCVILAKDPDEARRLSQLIPAFTHCNVYETDNVHYLIPSERVFHNYMVFLRLEGVTDINAYTQKYSDHIFGYFLGQNRNSMKEKTLVELIDRLKHDYPQFLKDDFRKELSEYRLNYVVSDGPLDEKILRSIKDLEFVAEEGGVYIYKF